MKFRELIMRVKGLQSDIDPLPPPISQIEYVDIPAA